MKKVKLMLISLTILAVVGGALAFTLKTSQYYCTAPTILKNGVTTCPPTCSLIGRVKPGLATQNICTTTTSQDQDDPCPITLGCFATNPGLDKE